MWCVGPEMNIDENVSQDIFRGDNQQSESVKWSTSTTKVKHGLPTSYMSMSKFPPKMGTLYFNPLPPIQ